MEFVLILPVVLLLVFGIIEYAFAFNTDSQAQQAARAAGRAASTQPTDGAAMVNAAVGAASSAMSNLPSNTTPVLWVYKNTPLGNSNPPAGCGGGSCVQVTFHKAGGTWVADAGLGTPWQPVKADFCNAPFSEVGTLLTVQYHLVSPGLFTSFLGNPRTMKANAVFRLEPAPSDKCSGP